MIIMWIIPKPLGKCATVFGEPKGQNGGWIDACAECMREYLDNNELHIVAPFSCDKSFISDNSIRYYLVNVKRKQGRIIKGENDNKWKVLIEKIHPDVIQVWGTELSIGMDILGVAGSIPVVFFIQGVMNAISEHTLGDLSYSDYINSFDPLNLFRIFWLHYNKKRIIQQALLEKEMVLKSNGIVVDSEWAAAQYIESTSNAYYVSLPINNIFSQYRWNISRCKRRTIFTVFGQAPIKGLHILLEAFKLVLNKYPDAQLIIPGFVDYYKPIKMKDSLYVSFMKRKIQREFSQGQIIFPGMLTHEQMAENMISANVFVMPSCIENHSSTLREAMTVGCPCITSDVGSVFEFATHGKNALIYRYNEVRTLAFYILKTFEDDDFACEIGKNAAISITEKYPQTRIGKALLDVYEIINENSREKEFTE